MVFVRYCMIAAVWFMCICNAHSQVVYYPAQASSLLQSTANDVALLFQKAISGSHFTTEPYNVMPSEGIILSYESSTLTDNQSCTVQSDGNNYIKFSAPEDNGLNFGVYQYINQLGFRFYQPGDIWEMTPLLSSPYKKIDTVYSCSFKYKTWFISGGHNRWIMDNNNDTPWDIYFGENGHQWALYQRRNNMMGANRFTGHRDDLMTGDYLTTLQNNPCYVAPYNGSRKVTGQSVPDINNNDAKDLWRKCIEQKYAQFKNSIFSNKVIYPNILRNFNYNYDYIGIEVPDGAHWANSTDNSGCSSNVLLSESDQHFTLANFVVSKINDVYPEANFQLYAYDGHADVPSSSIIVNDKIDIQVIPTSFQSVSSAKGLLNRWYSRSKNISEYHYLNLPQWSGETPSFFLDDLKTTTQRLKEKNSQGIVLEASPAKFASLPFLLGLNNELKENISIDNTLHEFCDRMFAGASNTIYQLLQMWGDDKTVMLNNGIQDNKYKLPLYLSLLDKANNETKNASSLVKERLNELKAYVHYMFLYYDWVFDQEPNNLKEDKAAALCIYLAKVNKLKIVNSYFLITNLVNSYSANNSFVAKYNVTDGSAYQNGNLPLITASEIENNFTADISKYKTQVQQYNFEKASDIKKLFSEENLLPLEKIKVYLNYTQGKDYATKSEFFIDADKAGDFTIKYTPYFNMEGKGYINFTVEATDKTLGIIKDFSITDKDAAGLLTVTLPSAGTYKLTVISKYKSAADLEINTNGNYFYKNGPYLGNTIENYRSDLQSLPGYFHVPFGVSKIYFSLNNSNPGGNGFATPEDVSKAFIFKDNRGNIVQPKLADISDSALFYLEVPVGGSGSFWQSYKMEQYRLCFANISNIEWYAARKPCVASDFTVSIAQVNNFCTTQLKSSGNTGSNIHWRVEDAGQVYYYDNQQLVNLPDDISPNAVVTMTGNDICSITKRVGDDPFYIQQKRNCASGAAGTTVSLKTTLYPNPGRGLYSCLQNGQPVIPEEIIIISSTGAKSAHFFNVSQFNITNLPPGIYFYQLVIKNTLFNGRLVKL